jgi:zinc protease
MTLLSKLPAFLCLILSCLASVRADAQQAAPLSPAARAAWGFDASDLTPHPGVRFGVLPNGMRYAIMRNAAPANGLSVRLRFDAGAMDEEEGEQGYLHLLEHRIFHGSENIPAGALPLMLAHRGMERLTDFNAVTSYDETVYRLDLSKADHNARAAALMLMREISSRLSFTRRSVAAAKKDVQTEIDGRDAVRDRIMAAQNAFFLPGSPLARGPVIGSKASIRRASPEKLRRLYQHFYSPRHATLAIVGDFDPALAEAEIEARFSDWQPQGAEDRPSRRLFSLPSQRHSRAYLFADPKAPTGIAIASVYPLGGASDKAPLRDAQFLERIGNEMMNRRLAKTAAGSDAPFASASAASHAHFSAALLRSIDVAAQADWRRALVAVAAALRTALDEGFLQSELDEQLALTREALLRTAAPPINAALADGIMDAVGRQLVFTQAADTASTAAYLARVTLSDVNTAFRAAWADAGQLIFVTHSRRFPAAEAAIAETWKNGFESRPAR